MGPSCTDNYDVGGSGIIVQELEPGVLVDIDQWRPVWNDEGSGKSDDFALWNGVNSFGPPGEEYIALSSLLTRYWHKPTAEDTQGIKAVRRDVVVTIQPHAQVWTDKGTGAPEDGAVWTISAKLNRDAVETGAFVAVSGFDNPPSPVYGLDLSRVILEVDE